MISKDYAIKKLTKMMHAANDSTSAAAIEDCIEAIAEIPEANRMNGCETLDFEALYYSMRREMAEIMESCFDMRNENRALREENAALRGFKDAVELFAAKECGYHGRCETACGLCH